MAEDEELYSSESGEDNMLREALQALRTGDRTRARDLLTRLLKANQNNAQYWVYLSAVVDTQKERLYCLQTAMQVDPQNAAAKRGLIMLGALPPDDSVQPFPVNRPRLWEEKLKASRVPQDQPRGLANPLTRTILVLGIAILAVGLLIGGYSLFKGSFAPPVRPVYTLTHRPTFTIVPTITDTPAFRTATPTFLGPTPLWMFLDKTYTPTPLYVLTQHPITSRSAFEAGLRFLAGKDYKNALTLFQQAQGLEPDAPDIDYYIGEVYLGQASYHSALDAYQKSINKDANFAPAFLGRARANLALNPRTDVSKDLDEAINLDPHYAEAFIERGKYRLSSNPGAAESDFKAAIAISPDSALAFLYLSDAQLALDENYTALASAQRANQIDITLVPVYLALARAYIATGQSDQAVSVLQTYTIYEPNDTSAFLALGTAYNAAGQYQLAVDILNKAVDADRRNAEAYYQRGYAYLNLLEASLAQADFKSAISYDPSDFDSQLGLARALALQKKPGDAYMQAETKALPLAKTDSTKAQAYYWEAIFLDQMNETAGSQDSWTRLLALPADAMPAQWRNQAFKYLNITPTFTPSLTPTITPTPTPSPSKTQTPTKTLPPTATPGK